MEGLRFMSWIVILKVYFLNVVGPNGRVGIFRCLKTAALGKNAWT